jgi:hypothetical protein
MNRASHDKPARTTDIPGALRTETLAKGGWVDRGFAARWLEQHWKHRACPICSEREWGMLEQLVEMPIGARVPVAPQEYPCVLIACRRCGHTMLFSAVRMGVVPSNVYLVSKKEMHEVATVSAKGIVWWALAVAAASLALTLAAAGVVTERLNVSHGLLFRILPLGLAVVFIVALLAILFERRRRRSLLAAIEEESRVPTESRIEPSEITLN